MAIRIDQSSDAYSATNGLVAAADFTVTCWAYMVTNRATAQGIWSYTTAVYSDWYILGAGADGAETVFFNGATLSGTYAPGTGSWHKYAVTVSGTTLTLYAGSANGTLGVIGTATITPFTPEVFYIGGTPDSTQWGDGRVAAVKVWTTALSQSQCAAELSQFDPVITANLLRYHKLKVAETTDYSGNGNNLDPGLTTPTVEGDPPIPDIAGGFGTVTHVATSTPTPVGTTTSASTVAVTPTLPTGTVASDRVFVIQAGNNTNGGTPAGWTALATDVQVGPTGTAPGAGTGRRYLSVFYRDYDGAWTMPSFTLTSATQNTNACSAITLRKGAYDIWNTPAVSTAGNTSAAVTAYSVTTGSLATSSGSMMLVGTATNDNVTASAESLSQTGATFANLTERSDTGSATGNDVSIKTYTADVTTGATATLTHTATLSAASEGGSIVVMQSSTSGAPPRLAVVNQSALVRASSW